MTAHTTLSIDAMGGDGAPESVIGGIAKVAGHDPDISFILHGDGDVVAKALSKHPALNGRVDIRHADDVIEMDAKPSIAVRRGRKSSMWKALEAVRDGEAQAAVSAGNTGALMALALFCLRAAKGVDRPAIAALWPTLGKESHCVALDMGADIRADAKDLVRFAAMGSEYARIGLGIERPRVSLLNVGTEENKGRAEVREAAEMLHAIPSGQMSNFQFTGFIEANEITQGRADVVVTDGWTGNVALKSAEGAARFVGENLRDAFTHSIVTKISALFAKPSLNRLQRRIDPRRVNGGVFLGLNGLVVKSHGGADATGFAAAVDLAAGMARENFIERLATEVEKTLDPDQGDVMDSQTSPQDPEQNV
jgi:glycerol-3-phosphate acyltransferase PlsX